MVSNYGASSGILGNAAKQNKPESRNVKFSSVDMGDTPEGLPDQETDFSEISKGNVDIDVKPPEGKRRYMMALHGGKRRIVEVPADWKVTFGPLVPPRDQIRMGGSGSTFALRFYETANKQRAVYTDVLAFMDLDITIMEL